MLAPASFLQYINLFSAFRPVNISKDNTLRFMQDYE